MSNNITANYDVCFEITEAVLAGFAAANLGGKTYDIPLDTTYSGVHVVGQVHLLVQSATIKIDTTRSPYLAIILNLIDSTIRITAPADHTAAPLKGTITASAPLKFKDKSGKSQVVLDLTDATTDVDVSLDAASFQRVTQLMGYYGVPAAFADTILRQAMKAALASAAGVVELPGAAIKWTPGHDGSLDPLVFADLALCTRAASGGHAAYLGIMGSILQSHVGAEHLADKTQSATAASSYGSVTISPEAFRDLIFCPALAATIGVPRTALCPSCGSAPAVGMSGLNLTSLTATLAEGRINIHGTATKSGTGYSASATFDAHATLALQGGAIVPTIVIDNVDVDVDLDWWVWLLSGLTLGAVGITADAIAQSVLSSIASDKAKSALSSALANLGAIKLTGVPGGLYLTSVAIHTYGIVLQGTTYIPPAAVLSPYLHMDDSLSDVSRIQVGSGTATGVVICQAHKSYPYTDFSVTSRADFTVTAHDMGLPLTCAWKVAGVALTGASGTITFQSKAQVGFDAAAKPVDSTPHLNYAITQGGTRLTLINVPSDGRYQVDIECVATDPANVSSTAVDWVRFDGQQRVYGGDFQKDYGDCMALLLKAIREHSYQPPKWQPPGPGPVENIGDPLIDNAIVANTLVDLASKSGLDAGWMARSTGALAASATRVIRVIR